MRREGTGVNKIEYNEIRLRIYIVTNHKIERI